VVRILILSRFLREVMRTADTVHMPSFCSQNG
jgi:hypothetical protein